MIPSVRSAALRWVRLAISLSLAIALGAVGAAADPQVPLPRPRPIARNAAARAVDLKAVDLKTADATTADWAAKSSAVKSSAAKSSAARNPASRSLAPTNLAPTPLPSVSAADKGALAMAVPATTATAPANHLRGTLPVTPPRKPVVPAAVAVTASTPQADIDALESVIDLLRKHQPGDATQAEATIADPVAKKLAEWLILRSDDNGATVER